MAIMHEQLGVFLEPKGERKIHSERKNNQRHIRFALERKHIVKSLFCTATSFQTLTNYNILTLIGYSDDMNAA